MSEPVRHTLKHPVTFTFKSGDAERQETTAELTLRRLKGKDLRSLDDCPGDVSMALAMIAKSTGLTAMQVDELDAEDIAELGEKIEGFLPPGLRTGKMSSGT